jgi:sugar phosphate isomerase/epimerase
MNSWQSKCDFGIVHGLAFLACRAGEGPILETLQHIVNDTAFGAVEIAPPKDPVIRAKARDLLAASQLQVVYLPILPIIIEGLGIADEDAGKRKAALDKLKSLLDEAIEFNAPMAMVTGPKDPGIAGREAATARLIEDLRELCDYADAKAKGRRLFITLENFDRDIEKKRLIGPTVEAAALADAVDRGNFGLTIDLSHLPLISETPAHALKAAGRHLIHAHIGNCVVDHPESPLQGDFHPRFGHPLGCNDLPEVIEYLEQLNAVNFWYNAKARLGSTPILSMEIRQSDESSETVIANGKRTFERAWAAVNR